MKCKLLSIVCLLSSLASGASFTVTNLDDSGAGSLRQAILDANGNGAADTISFQAGLSGTISVSTEMAITGELTIDGDNDADSTTQTITLDGLNNSRVFNITAVTTIDNLTMTKGKAANGANGVNNHTSAAQGNGKAGEHGGAIYATSQLSIANSIISDSQSGVGGNGGYGRTAYWVNGSGWYGPWGGGVGGAGGAGGAIYSTANLTMLDSICRNNASGNGGSASTGGGGNSNGGGGSSGGIGGTSGAGGAIFCSAGSVLLERVTVLGNATGNGGNGGNGGVGGNRSGQGGSGGTGGQGLYGGSSGEGGGVYVAGTASLTVRDSEVNGNSTGVAGASGRAGSGGHHTYSKYPGYGGGGGYTHGGRTSGSGGGLAIGGSATLSLESTLLVGNVVGNGGNGNYGASGGSGGSGSGANSSASNGGRSGNGAGVYISTSGAVMLTDATLQDNTIGRGGSGYSWPAWSLHGEGGDGGGLYLNSGTVTLSGGLLTGNQAGSAMDAHSPANPGGEGGAIYNKGTINYAQYSGTNVVIQYNQSGASVGNNIPGASVPETNVDATAGMGTYNGTGNLTEALNYRGSGLNGFVGTGTNLDVNRPSVALTNELQLILPGQEESTLDSQRPSVWLSAWSDTNYVGTGIAITGGIDKDADDDADDDGEWQYQLVGESWTAFPADIATNNALLLRSTDSVRFVPTQGESDVGYVYFSFKAWDEGFVPVSRRFDTTNSDFDEMFATSESVASLMIGGFVFKNLDSDTPSWSEAILSVDNPTVSVEVGGDITTEIHGFTDGVSIIDGGKLEVAGNVLMSDVLRIVSSGSVTISGSNVVFSGTTVGTLSGGTATTALEVIFNNDALLTETNQIAIMTGLIQGLRYTNDSNAPGSNKDVTIKIFKADASGLSAPYHVTLTIVNQNDAPVLTDQENTLTGMMEDEDATPNEPAGDLVSAIIADAAITDEDYTDSSSAPEAIAVIATTGTGTWQYDLDGAGSWTNFGAVSDGASLLLSPTDKIRYVSSQYENGVKTITFRAWDETVGTNGTKGASSANGTTNAFSAATDTASISVTGINAEPSAATGLSFDLGSNDTDLTPLFSFTTEDVDPEDSTVQNQVQIGTVSNFASGVVVDFTSAFTNEGANTFAPSADLAPNTLYFWQIRSFDDEGSNGVWTAGASFTILQPNLKISLNTATALEAATSTVVYTITLRNAADDAAMASDETVTVDYVLTGIAQSGADYALTGGDYTNVSDTITFAPGESSKTLQMVVVDEALNEVDETLIATISNPVKAALQATVSQTHTIENDAGDALSILFDTSTDYTVQEDGSATAQIVVKLSTISGQEVQVSYTTSDGTATLAGSDYLASAGTLTFAAGDVSETFNVSVNVDDNLFEGTETINLTLSNPVGTAVTLGAEDTDVLSIIDDETGEVRFTASTGTTDENSGPHQANITLALTGDGTPVLQSDLIIDIDDAATGSASTNTDYTAIAPNAQMTFGAGGGGSNQNFEIVYTGDTIVEPDETVVLVLSGDTAPDTTVFTNQGVHTATIENEDGATIDIAKAKLVLKEDESTTGDTYVVKLSNEIQEDATMTVSFTEGTAVLADIASLEGTGVSASGDEYRFTFNSANWDVDQTFTVKAEDDQLLEYNVENLVLLHAVANADNGNEDDSITLTNLAAEVLSNNDRATLIFHELTATAQETYPIQPQIKVLLTTTGSGDQKTQEDFSLDLTCTDISATKGVDYTNTTSVSIPSNTPNNTIVVFDIATSGTNSGPRQFSVTLNPSTDPVMNVLVSLDVLTATITDKMNLSPEAVQLMSPIAFAGVVQGDDSIDVNDQHVFGRTVNQRPKLVWNVPSDFENQKLHFEVEIIADINASSNTVDLIATSASNQVGFEYYNGTAWVAFPAAGAPSGAYQVRYTPTTDLGLGKYHTWRVRARDVGFDGTPNNDDDSFGLWSDSRCFYAFNRTWTDEVLAQGASIKKDHLDELRAEADFLLAFRGIAPDYDHVNGDTSGTAAWTDPSIASKQTRVKAVHWNEQQAALQRIDGFTTFSSGVVLAGVSRIHADHITELRTQLVNH